MPKPALISPTFIGPEILSVPGSKIAVLVVEDEFLIRMDIADSLETAGFIVYEAANAREAIDMLDRHPHIQAMFTDVDMPGGMDGVRLAALARDRWPPLKIIITSGYRKMSSDDMPSECRFFDKPYSLDRVITTIREMTVAN
jgi:two-component system, response regulator PdtaR